MNLIGKLLKYLDKIRITNSQSEIQETLRAIEDLLRKYTYTLEANTVMAISDVLVQDENKAYKQMIDEAWWVGEDAVAEADLSIAGGFTSEARLDQDIFQELIIKLYQHLQDKGYQSDHAQLVTSQYNKWLVSRM